MITSDIGRLSSVLFQEIMIHFPAAFELLLFSNIFEVQEAFALFLLENISLRLC